MHGKIRPVSLREGEGGALYILDTQKGGSEFLYTLKSTGGGVGGLLKNRTSSEGGR